MSSKFCDECGQQLRSTAKFCTHCREPQPTASTSAGGSQTGDQGHPTTSGIPPVSSHDVTAASSGPKTPVTTQAASTLMTTETPPPRQVYPRSLTVGISEGLLDKLNGKAVHAVRQEAAKQMAPYKQGQQACPALSLCPNQETADLIARELGNATALHEPLNNDLLQKKQALQLFLAQQKEKERETAKKRNGPDKVKHKKMQIDVQLGKFAPANSSDSPISRIMYPADCDRPEVEGSMKEVVSEVLLQMNECDPKVKFSIDTVVLIRYSPDSEQVSIMYDGSKQSFQNKAFSTCEAKKTKNTCFMLLRNTELEQCITYLTEQNLIKSRSAVAQSSKNAHSARQTPDPQGGYSRKRRSDEMSTQMSLAKDRADVWKVGDVCEVYCEGQSGDPWFHAIVVEVTATQDVVTQYYDPALKKTLGRSRRIFKKGSGNFMHKLRRPAQTSHGHDDGARAAQKSAVTDAEESGTNDDNMCEYEKKIDERFDKRRAEKADKDMDEEISRDKEREQQEDSQKAERTAGQKMQLKKDNERLEYALTMTPQDFLAKVLKVPEEQVELAIQTHFQYSEHDHKDLEAHNEKCKTGLWDAVKWTRKAPGPAAYMSTEADHKRLLRDKLTLVMPNLTPEERENFVIAARKTNEDNRKDFVMRRQDFDDWWENNKKGLFSLAQLTIQHWDFDEDKVSDEDE